MKKIRFEMGTGLKEKGRGTEKDWDTEKNKQQDRYTDENDVEKKKGTEERRDREKEMGEKGERERRKRRREGERERELSKFYYEPEFIWVRPWI